LPHILGFFPELAKLLHVATILNTAAMYHLYVVVVLKILMWGATARLTFQHSITSCALEETSCNHSDYHLPIITIEPQMNYLSFDGGDDWLELIDWH
jgi:hypothetical protein